MGENGSLFPRFFRIATTQCTKRNKMNLPARFIDVHGGHLPKDVRFQLLNGVETCAKFKFQKSKIYGVANFFGNPPFGEECRSVFNYMGNGIFIVYVFTNDYTEVEYASTGLNEFVQDKMNGIGWKFLSTCISARACNLGLVEVPLDFVSRFGHLIPPEITFSLPNGQVFSASYCSGDHMIRGLQIFHLYNVLMFTYRGNGAFDLVLFDHCGGEKALSSHGARTGLMVGIGWQEFKIQVQKFHLYQYCHGIDIGVDYEGCTKWWSNGEYLTVSYEGNVFFLEIHLTERRWKIHAGWVRFAKLLDLKVGDVLVFRMTDHRLTFSVAIYCLAERKVSSPPQNMA